MFDLNSFIVTNLVKGVKNGTFTKEYANITAVNYLSKGMLTEDDVISVNAQVEAWEAEKNAVYETVEPSEEIPVEDVAEEETTAEESSEDTAGETDETASGDEDAGENTEEVTEDVGEESAEELIDSTEEPTEGTETT